MRRVDYLSLHANIVEKHLPKYALEKHLFPFSNHIQAILLDVGVFIFKLPAADSDSSRLLTLRLWRKSCWRRKDTLTGGIWLWKYLRYSPVCKIPWNRCGSVASKLTYPFLQLYYDGSKGNTAFRGIVPPRGFRQQDLNAHLASGHAKR